MSCLRRGWEPRWTMRSVMARRSHGALRTGAYWLALCAGCVLAAACGDDTATDTAASPDAGADAAADALRPAAQGRDPRARLRGRRGRSRAGLPARRSAAAPTSTRSPPSRSTPASRARARSRSCSTSSTATRSTSRTASKYQIHYEFASAHLSGSGLPIVPVARRVQRHRVLLARPPLRARRGHVLRRARTSGRSSSRRTTRPRPTMIDEALRARSREAAYFGPALSSIPTSRGGRDRGRDGLPTTSRVITHRRAVRRHRLPAAQPRHGDRPAALRRRRPSSRPSTSASATSSCSTRARTTSRS